ncbi:MAG TPA: Gfo/Idh/MocA family oxidoreductase [Dehalococcoidia bacterium]|nr:Gfo/Idh/MocA family oxidoreductase [Dehalococcoidia bacterium]
MTRELAAGVAGLGFGANHARVLDRLPGVHLAAVCDRDQTRLNAATRGRRATAYDNFETMLREEKLDAVVIAVPEKLHLPFALLAIAAGCAVLVEKPLATSYEEGAKLVHAAAAAGVPLMAGHIERFNPAVQELRRRVYAGQVGEVLHLAARRTAPMRVRTQDVNVVHDSALHDIDAMRYVLGREVESVFAQGQRDVLQPFEDSIAGVMRFAGPDGARGAVGSLEVNWLSPLRIRELTVLGTKGILVLDYAAQTLEFHAASARPSSAARDWSTEASRLRDPSAQIPIERREQLVVELTAFVEAVRDGSPMPVSGEDALQTLAVADALTQSARTGQPVQVRRD